MRPTDPADEQPGRPNTPLVAMATMVTMGLVLITVLVVVPPISRAMATHPTETDLYIPILTGEWIKALYSPAAALANAVSAFAVLLLTLFIEESLKASDKVAVGTRRNIAMFAFVGGVATVAVTILAIVGATGGGNVSAAVQTLGSAFVVLFFASHIATRSVVSLAKQRQALQNTREIIAAARRIILGLRPLSIRGTVWTLGVFGALLVAIIVTGFVLAERFDPENTSRWLGGLLGFAYLIFMLFFLTYGTTPGNSKPIRIGARAGWGIVALMLAFGTAVAFQLNSTDVVALPMLFVAADVIALMSLPMSAMPRWSLTGAARAVQYKTLTTSKRANDEAIAKLDAWEMSLPFALLGDATTAPQSEGTVSEPGTGNSMARRGSAENT